MNDIWIDALARAVVELFFLPINVGFVWLLVNRFGFCEWAGIPRPDLRQIAVLCFLIMTVS